MEETASLWTHITTSAGPADVQLHIRRSKAYPLNVHLGNVRYLVMMDMETQPSRIQEVSPNGYADAKYPL